MMWRRSGWLFLGLIACSTDPKTTEDTNDETVDSGDTAGAVDSGDPVYGTLVWADDDHDLGEVAPGCTGSETRALENVGEGPVVVSAVTVSDAVFSVAVDAALPVELAPGDSLALTVAAIPTVVGLVEADLVVETTSGEGTTATETVEGSALWACETVAAGGSSSRTEDWTTDVQTADIMLVLDTTCSMSDFLEDVALGFGEVAAALGEPLPDASFSVASFDDYNYSADGEEMGSGVDKPFHLKQGQTLDTEAVTAVLTGLIVHNGSDWPESTFEAMQQAVAGVGFDQDCDGTFDAEDDVPPFLASTADPFSGTGGQNAAGDEVGAVGGTGRRADTMSFVVVGTDAELRDPDAGYSVPSEACPTPAGHSSTTAAFQAAGTKVVSLLVNSDSESVPFAQLSALAEDTDSVVDLDGDGTPEPAVVEYRSDTLATDLPDTIAAFTANLALENIRADAIVPDGSGLSVSVEVDAGGATTTGEPVSLTIDFTDDGTATESVPVEVRLLADIDGRATVLRRLRVMVQRG